MRPARKLTPLCVDCGERDRSKFYSHPTHRSGCQARCKRCDNKNRMARNPLILFAAKRVPRPMFDAMRDVIAAARVTVEPHPTLRQALKRLDALEKESNGT